MLSVVVVGAALATSCSSNATKSNGAFTTVIGGTTTTVADGAPGDTTVPTSTVAPTTTIVGVGPPVAADSGPSVWIAGASAGDPEVVQAAAECDTFFVAIADFVGDLVEYMLANPDSFTCGTWNANGGIRTWTLTRGASGLFLAIIWQRNASMNWVPMMRALEPAPGVWDEFLIQTDNIDGGSNDELVSGVRLAGSGGFLSVDIIDIRSGNPRTVAVLNEVAQGFAYLLPSDGVEVWEAQYADADPECCPSMFVRHHITAESTGWFVTSGPAVPAGDSAMERPAAQRL